MTLTDNGSPFFCYVLLEVLPGWFAVGNGCGLACDCLILVDKALLSSSETALEFGSLTCTFDVELALSWTEDHFC